MTILELKQIVARGEGLYTEFKRKVNHPDKIVKEVVAFANTKGGKLLLGVDDDKTIVGLKYANEDEFEMRKAIEYYCKPAINYTITKITVALNRSVLVFDIFPNEIKPVFVIYNFKKNTGVAYIRVADQSLQASLEIRKILQGNSQNEGISFTYTEKERVLMQYLAKYEKIDVLTFASVAQIPVKEASNILVKLTLAKVLLVESEELKDWFKAVL